MSLSIAEVYDKIAPEFDKTRVAIWPNVRKFLDNLSTGSLNLDIGCGNGKNMMYRCDVDFIGIDISKEQVRICQDKGLIASEASMVCLPYTVEYFNNILCIASYHHLDNDIDRMSALQEMYRCLKKGGRALITVWAMEQGEEKKRNFTKRDEMVQWKSKDGVIYYRYYHIYNEGDLEEEVWRLEPRLRHVESGWEAGNWWMVVEKA